MILFLSGVFAIFAFALLCHWLWAKTKPRVSINVILIASAILIGSIGLLVAAGRVHWLAGAGTALLPFLRRGVGLLRLVPLLSNLRSLFGAGGYGGLGGFSPFQSHRNETAGHTNNTSETRTDMLSMELNHETGEMSGTVLQGPFANRELSSLSSQEIVDLYNSLELESQRLLGAYIQRYHPDLAAGNAGEDQSETSEPQPDTITPDRARKILGVEKSATKEEIVEAHRRLMQKNHPDRGGSEYIASEINQAKEVLLKLI